MTEPKKPLRGFATLSIERRRQIASEGGRAAHEKGTAHEFTSEEARAAGRKGGAATSANKAAVQHAAKPEVAPPPQQRAPWPFPAQRV